MCLSNCCVSVAFEFTANWTGKQFYFILFSGYDSLFSDHKGKAAE